MTGLTIGECEAVRDEVGRAVDAYRAAGEQLYYAQARLAAAVAANRSGGDPIATPQRIADEAGVPEEVLDGWAADGSDRRSAWAHIRALAAEPVLEDEQAVEQLHTAVPELALWATAREVAVRADWDEAGYEPTMLGRVPQPESAASRECARHYEQVRCAVAAGPLGGRRGPAAPAPADAPAGG